MNILVEDIEVIVAVEDIVKDFDILVEDMVVKPIVAVEDNEDVDILVEDTVVGVVDVLVQVTRCWWLQRPRPGSKRVPAGQRNRWLEPWASQR